MARISVLFDANVARAKAAIKSLAASTQARFKNMGDTLKRAFSGVKGIIGGVAAFTGITMGISAVSSKIHEMDMISKRSRSLGMTGEQLQELRYACNSANVGFEEFQGTIPKINRTIAQAAAGSAEAQKKLAMLGLTVDDFSMKNSYERIQLVAKAINNIGDHAEKTAAAMAFFEEQGGKMLDFFSGLSAASEEFRRNGGPISDSALKAAELYEQKLTDIGNVIHTRIMGSGLMEWLLGAAEGAANIVGWISGGDEAAKLRNLILEAKNLGIISDKQAGKYISAASFYDPKKGGIHEEITGILAELEVVRKEKAWNDSWRKNENELVQKKKKRQADQEKARQEKEEAEKKKAAEEAARQQRELEKANRIRQKAQEKTVRESISALEKKAQAIREQTEVSPYEGDAIRRIGGTIGGAGSVERYQQTVIRKSEQQIQQLQLIRQEISRIKTENKSFFS